MWFLQLSVHPRDHLMKSRRGFSQVTSPIKSVFRAQKINRKTQITAWITDKCALNIIPKRAPAAPQPTVVSYICLCRQYIGIIE